MLNKWTIVKNTVSKSAIPAFTRGVILDYNEKDETYEVLFVLGHMHVSGARFKEEELLVVNNHHLGVRRKPFGRKSRSKDSALD
jgi:hypothetical protein